jgi:hypothetical protein
VDEGRFDRLRLFTWKDCALETLIAYREATKPAAEVMKLARRI